MAFNPEIPDTGIPNLTGVSRGTGPNRTFEALFSGIADTVTNVANIKDQATQAQIEDEAVQLFDEVNQEFGVDAPPPGMQGELDRVEALQNALEQGKISETNYYGRLATLSKQLRAKYPKYERIVDSTIQSVTGTRPANAFRDAIFSELNQISQSASDEAKFQRQYVKENEGIIAALGIDPSSTDFNQMRAKVAQFKGQAEIIDADLKRLQHLTTQGEYNEQQAMKTLNRDFSFLTQAELNRGIGAEGANFQTMITEFMSGNMADPEAFVANLGAAEGRLRQSLLQRGMQEYVSKGLATQEQVNDAIDAAMYPIEEAKKAILGGDFVYAGKLATINKIVQDRALNDLLVASPQLQVGMGLSKVNEMLGAEYLQTHRSEIDTAAQEVVGRIAGGSQTDIVQKAFESGDQALGRKVIETSVDALKSQTTIGQDLTNIVDQYYGPEAYNAMSAIAPEDRLTYYTKMVDPAVIKAVAEKGTPDDLQKITDWALEKALAIPELRGAAADLSSTAALAKAEVVYNPETNRVDLVLSEDVRAGTTPLEILQNVGLKPYRRATTALNKVLAVLDPLAEATGGDKSTFVESLLTELNVDIAGGSKGSLFGKALESVKTQAAEEEAGIPQGDVSVGPVTIEGEENEDEGDFVVPEEQILPTEIDFVFSAPEIASELTSDPVYAPAIEEAASGPFTGPLSEFRDMSSPVQIANAFNGLSEKRDKAVIASFIKKAAGIKIDPSKTPWCAAFVNAVLGATGQEGTGRLNARSFLNYGTPTQSPTQGDIVVFSRGNSSWQGHVGFYVGEDETHIRVLGGNQGNKVSIARYPKSRLLGYRKPPQIN